MYFKVMIIYIILSTNILLYYIENFYIFKYEFLLSLEEFEWQRFNTKTGSSTATYNLSENTFKNEYEYKDLLIVIGSFKFRRFSS